MAGVMLRVATKTAIGAGAIYVTIEQGVWNNSSTGSQALSKVKDTVLPAANDYARQIPTFGDVGRTITGAWNTGVQTVFSGASSAPSVAGEYTMKAVESSSNFVKDSLK